MFNKSPQFSRDFSGILLSFELLSSTQLLTPEEAINEGGEFFHSKKKSPRTVTYINTTTVIIKQSARNEQEEDLICSKFNLHFSTFQLMAIYEDRISALSDELDDFMEGYEANSQRHNTTFIKEGFLDKLSGIIASVRDAQTDSYSGLDGLTMQADRVLSNAIRWAYQNEPVAPYSDDGCMPSFAHEESVAPLLADERKEGEFCTSQILSYVVPPDLFRSSWFYGLNWS